MGKTAKGSRSKTADNITSILEDLTGQKMAFMKDLGPDKKLNQKVAQLLVSSGLGYSQLNELLLFLGYDRIQPAFFQFLLDGSVNYKVGEAFKSLAELRRGVDRFRIRAILRFGNVKYAFEYLSSLSQSKLEEEMALFNPIDTKEFAKRHQPLLEVEKIPGDKTYYLGYLNQEQLDARLKNPDDNKAKQELQTRNHWVEIGKNNHRAYLVSDHMDVYVATSMRERHEYQIVSKVVEKVFSSSKLQELKIRWFDPTQAYCEERIDKGLAEGLMLKRALCTLYLAQESDTFGKDSELASTLAQGKPVIVYIPSVNPQDQNSRVEELLTMVKEGTPDSDDRKLVLQQLRVFCPEAAWLEKKVMSWVSNDSKMDLTAAKQKLGNCMRKHYDKRAKTLKESHPLGLQVHLETGVANGVLVARSTAQCADLIRRVLTNQLEFDICEKKIGDNVYLLLKEKISDSVFRVVTGDSFLTNAFWNFYLAR